MKALLVLLIIVFAVSILNADYYNHYIECNAKKLEQMYDSLSIAKKPVSDSLLFYTAELTSSVVKSVTMYTQIVTGIPDSPFYNNSVYRLAKYNIMTKDTARALDQLKKLIYSKDVRFSPLSYIAIIGHYEKMGDNKTAGKYINEFITEYKGHPFLKNYTVDANTKRTGDLQNYYTVQVGSFSTEENADKMLQDYLKKGYEAYKIMVKGQYKVRIGKYGTKDDANTFLKVFQKAEAVGAWIVKVD